MLSIFIDAVLFGMIIFIGTMLFGVIVVINTGGILFLGLTDIMVKTILLTIVTQLLSNRKLLSKCFTV